ncbi:fructose 1,6-bisphosphatase [Coxiella-like endosymbiont of Rhipicephalus sanguineus]|uniref:fructose 1,6-bisphosphatase n=1 Tax=Coxiella-like endosymbiont of Rhipicephalus sanguineus TaxID=1955402 RepID=UPI00255B212D|nr:fructose 1,6-bisphosphatase [Coxiella-like endosymbiont of Rhipicephalus sanguineus]
MEITLSIIKADVGSISGHTRPIAKMLDAIQTLLKEHIDSGLLINELVMLTGDDIAIIFSYQKGLGNKEVHMGSAWQAFLSDTNVTKNQGNYGSSQNLLVDAPSGNV